jgi:hypothetical protein
MKPEEIRKILAAEPCSIGRTSIGWRSKGTDGKSDAWFGVAGDS